MNLQKITRSALMLGFFLLLFAIRPGFGKMDLEHYNPGTNGEMTRLTDRKVRIFRQYSYGFELHCGHAVAKIEKQYAEENTGLVSTAFIQ